MIRRIFSLTLVLCMLLAAMAGCGDTAQNDQTDTADAAVETEAETKDSLAARLDVSDNLPDADFGGSTFMICGDDAYLSYYIVEEQTGEVVNDAVFQRNLKVQERYNVSIDANVFAESELMKNVKNSVLAADDAYQMIACHIIMQGMAAVDGTMYNWYDLPYVNFDQPWWSDSTKEDLTYKNMAFIAIGDFGLSSIYSTYCMFYNKELAVEYSLPNMYELVNAGDWTLDKMMELCDGVYTDLNGDGTKDLADKHALITDCKSAANSYLWAFGKKIATQQKDGTYDLSYYDDKLVSIVEKMYNLYYDSGYVFTDPKSWGDTFMPAFTEGRGLFFNGQLRHAVGTFRDVEFDFGMIPYPKWDDAQEGYYTSVDGGHEGLAIPKSVQDKEYIGIMAEVLNAESWKLVVPAYYDTALKYKGARDEESIAIIDMLMDARIFDFGYVYGGWGCVFWLQYMMEGATKDITSYYEKNFGAYEKTMEKVFEAFDTYSVE